MTVDAVLFTTLGEIRAVLFPEKLVTLSRLERIFPEIPPVLPFSNGGELLENSMEDSSLSPFGDDDSELSWGFSFLASVKSNSEPSSRILLPTSRR